MREIELSGAKAAGRVVLVDDEDYESLAQRRWHIWEQVAPPGRHDHGPYAATTMRIDGRYVGRKMHTIMTGWLKTDHANGNGLDNRRVNLREATQSENAMNRQPLLGCSSPFKGVSWHKGSKRWAAYIKVNGKRRHIGHYANDVEAALAYDREARKEFGAFARPNFPTEADIPPRPVLLDPRAAEREALAEVAAQFAGVKTSPGERLPIILRLREAGCSNAAIGRAFGVNGEQIRYDQLDIAARRARRQRATRRLAVSERRAS
jgi:hypothetical protein